MLIPFILSLALAAPLVTSRTDDALTSRELAGISDEQALLSRQLGRLRQTMEVLALRLEAEGRTHAVKLLRDGLELLNDRTTETQSLTLEESMEDARERMQNGQIVQSLERQARVIEGLTELLAVLMERGNLDNIEEKLDRIREMKESIQELSTRQAENQDKTRELREDSTSDAQRDLEARIAEAQAAQRELLEATERAGRESGALELEQIEAALNQLQADLEKDRAVTSAWKPSEAEQLQATSGNLEKARRAEDRAQRLDEAAQFLSATAGATGPEAAAEETEQALAELEKRTERAERHARASGDEVAGQVAEAMKATLEAMRASAGENGEGSEDSAAKEQASQSSARLSESAAQQRSTAGEERRRALDELSDLSESKTVGGLIAEEVSELLEAAEAAAAENGDSARREAAQRTDEAAGALKRGLDEEKRMAENIAGSEEELAEVAKRLERGVETLEVGDSSEGREARKQLNAAAESMRAAAEAARGKRPIPAQSSMMEAEAALEQASAALSKSREQADSAGAEARADAQRELAASVSQLKSEAAKGSMSAEAEAATEQALGEAEAAMNEAAKELDANRGAAAAEAQREASRALSKAQRSAEGGMEPQTEEQRERAAEASDVQEQIKEDILQLATRDDEKRNPAATEKLQQASESAGEAGEQLDRGELDDAEQSEEDVQKELEQAVKKLEEEEEKYEQLRQEELLFKIIEEVQSATDNHATQMAATREVNELIADRDSPSRSQKIRLRKIAREEEAIAERIDELANALEEERSMVFAVLLRQARDDLNDIALDLGATGDFDTGIRTQSRQQDVEEALEWLLEALHQEQQRREEEAKQEEEQQQQEQEESENRLVPDAAELKLLRRMEVDIQSSVERLIVLYPELSEMAPDEINPLILEDINRLALKHERTSELFTIFRARLGIPDPDPESN